MPLPYPATYTIPNLALTSITSVLFRLSQIRISPLQELVRNKLRESACQEIRLLYNKTQTKPNETHSNIFTR